MEKKIKPIINPNELTIQNLTLNIFYTNYWLLEKYYNVLKKFQLKDYNQYYALKLLGDSSNKPIPLISLKGAFFDKKINLSRLIDTLVVLDLVSRIQSKKDRRAVILKITSKGKEILNQLNQLFLNIESKENDILLIEGTNLNTLLNNFRNNNRLP